LNFHENYLFKIYWLLDNNKAEQIWTKTSLNQRLFEGTAIGIFSK
tara:strand:+ start:7896 stop:8030 length:135 start_codon:yes stop_codon:yes gene_type:complete